MKKIFYKMNVVAWAGFFCLYLSACKKGDTTYENYVNTIQTYNGSALDYLKAQPKGTFDSLLLVLNRCRDLSDALANNKVTLFAPVNNSFTSSLKYLNIQRTANGKKTINLSNADQDELFFMLSKYIIDGDRTSDAYESSLDGVLLKSVVSSYPMHIKYVKLSSAGYEKGGPTELNFSDPHGSTFISVWTTTTTKAVNIKTNNATINILSPLHNFGFNEFTLRLDK